LQESNGQKVVQNWRKGRSSGSNIVILIYFYSLVVFA